METKHVFNEAADALNAKPIAGYRAGAVMDGMTSGVLLQFKLKDGSESAYSFPPEMALRMAGKLLEYAAIAHAVKTKS